MRFSQIFLKMKYSAVVKVYKVVRCDANDDRTVIDSKTICVIIEDWKDERKN